MSDDAKFTQADLDALKAEHTKAINDLNERHKYEIDRKVEAATWYQKQFFLVVWN